MIKEKQREKNATITSSSSSSSSVTTSTSTISTNTTNASTLSSSSASNATAITITSSSATPPASAIPSTCSSTILNKNNSSFITTTGCNNSNNSNNINNEDINDNSNSSKQLDIKCEDEQSPSSVGSNNSNNSNIKKESLQPGPVASTTTDSGGVVSTAITTTTAITTASTTPISTPVLSSSTSTSIIGSTNIGSIKGIVKDEPQQISDNILSDDSIVSTASSLTTTSLTNVTATVADNSSSCIQIKPEDSGPPDLLTDNENSFTTMNNRISPPHEHNIQQQQSQPQQHHHHHHLQQQQPQHQILQQPQPPQQQQQSQIPSNIINKQSNTIEYMQQQSQIFVFSTALANAAAEAVYKGLSRSIIDFHLQQTVTKKFLEKYPLKDGPFQRQNQTQWLMRNQQPQHGGRNNNLKQQPHSMMNHSQQNPTTPFATNQNTDDLLSNSSNTVGSGSGPGPTDDLQSWGDNSNNHLSGDPSGLDVDNLVPGGGSPHMQNTSHNNNTNSNNSSNNNSNLMSQQSPSGIGGCGGMQPSLQGTQVPDENLTPQQLQHREEQLATLRRMKCLLFRDPPDFPINDADPNKMSSVGGANNMAGLMGSGGPGGMAPGGPVSGNMMNAGMSPGNMGPTRGPAGGAVNVGGMLSGPSGNLMGPRRPIGNQPTMNDGSGMMSMNDMQNMNCNNSSHMSGPHHGNMLNNIVGPQHPNQQQMLNNMGGMNQHMGGNPNSNQMMNSMNMLGGPGQGPGSGGPGMMRNPPNTVQAQMEWNKLQHQYYEERKGKVMPSDMGLIGSGLGGVGGINNNGMSINNNNNNNNNIRQMSLVMRQNQIGGVGGGNGLQQGGGQSGVPRGSQGPPPPYHQTPRSASVPIATQSPNPGSPNNPTSNLSLPSPRGSSSTGGGVGSGGSSNSQINSPADPTRQQPPPPSSNQQPFKHLGPGQSPQSQDSPIGGGGTGGINTSGPRASMNHSSNPSTPISSHHLSPNASLKDLDLVVQQNNSGEFEIYNMFNNNFG